MDDRIISLVLVLVVVMSGVNSVVVLVAVGDSDVPGHITVTVDPATLFSELQESPTPAPAVYSAEEDEPETDSEPDTTDDDNTDQSQKRRGTRESIRDAAVAALLCDDSMLFERRCT
jgi:hypothetical protein